MTGAMLDTAAYAELQDTMGPDFAAELLETFLAEAPAMLGDLQQAAATGDAESFRRAAHSIKSNAGLFGAVALADMARDMELGGLPTAAPDAIIAEYGRACAALRGLLNG
jgi:HPt (histidine-containing phosphotransfer) domain-containing protein